MAKRVGDSDNDNPRRKRQKCTKDFESEHDIKCLQAPEDLSSILSFEQDAGPGTFKSKVNQQALRALLTLAQGSSYLSYS